MRTLPTRTALEPTSGPAGLAARVEDPGGGVRPVAVRVRDGAVGLIRLPAPPLALAPRRDGLWVMDASSVTAVDDSGKVTVKAQCSGMRLLAAAADGVWLLGLNACWLISATGEAQAMPSPWRDPFDVCLADGLLAGWDRAGETFTLDGQGQVSRRPAAVAKKPFERLLRLGAGTALTARLRALVHRDGAGETVLDMVGVGLTEQGEAFFAGRYKGRTWLWREGGGVDELATHVDEQILAVHGDHVLVASRERARRLTAHQRGFDPHVLWGGGEAQFALDEDTYEQRVLPSAWTQEAPFPFVVDTAGRVVVSASGPTGTVLISLRWPPA